MARGDDDDDDDDGVDERHTQCVSLRAGSHAAAAALGACSVVARAAGLRADCSQRCAMAHTLCPYWHWLGKKSRADLYGTPVITG